METAEKLSTQLALLAKGEGIEIMEYVIRAGKRFKIDPGAKSTFEFFYILSGILYLVFGEKERELRRGDYIVAQDITETAHFKTRNKVRLLYISSQPVFGVLSKEIRELTKIARQVARKTAYTYDHGKRMEKYVTQVGERLQLTPEDMERLVNGAVFHDVGKIDIPDAILQKPGKLTDAEWEIIKKHPIIGRDMVVAKGMVDIADIVAQHHERIDGNGYPLGLTDDKICIGAKIVAAVDAFDAMTSKRPYRPALLRAEALAELRAKSGTQFDSEVVEALAEVLQEEDRAVRKKRSVSIKKRKKLKI